MKRITDLIISQVFLGLSILIKNNCSPLFCFGFRIVKLISKVFVNLSLSFSTIQILVFVKSFSLNLTKIFFVIQSLA